MWVSQNELSCLILISLVLLIHLRTLRAFPFFLKYSSNGVLTYLNQINIFTQYTYFYPSRILGYYIQRNC